VNMVGNRRRRSQKEVLKENGFGQVEEESLARRWTPYWLEVVVLDFETDTNSLLCKSDGLKVRSKLIKE
jgi:hypothetical protein